MSSANVWDKRLRVITYGLLAIGLLINGLNWFQVATVEEFTLGSLLHDDGYYYLLIAEHIVKGQGATFDGINPTTGFQPLYQGLTLLIVGLSQWTRSSVFRWIFFVNLILTGLAAWTIGRAVKNLRPGVQGLPVYILAGIMLPLNFPLVFKRLGAGMEMALALLLFSLLLLTVSSEKTAAPDLRFRLREGLLLGLLTLTRLDYAVFAAAYGAFIIYTWRRRWRAQLAAYAAGYAAVVGAYFVCAYFFLDTVLPVSFLAKQYYASVQVSSLTLAERGVEFLTNLPKLWLYPLGYALFGFYWQWGAWGLAGAALAVALGGLGLAAIHRRHVPATWARPAWAWLMLAVAAHALVLAWSGTGFINAAFFWYYAPELFLMVASLILLCAEALRQGSLPGRIVALALMAVFLSSTYLYKLEEDLAAYAPYRQAIEVVRELTPPTAVIGSWDAGYNAYWLRPRTVINLDGMVNSRAYLETVIKPGDYARYYSAQRIEYLVNMAPDAEAERANIAARFFRHPSIVRACYDILAEMPFARQGLVVYLLRYHCGAP